MIKTIANHSYFIGDNGNCCNCMLFVWLAHQINYMHCLTARDVTPWSSVLLPATTVKCKVKDQEAKIVKVKDQT